ncbi:MAG: ferritin [Actinomycetota bacterium]|nr:ferritin [Actinomycetota bacterium]
MLSDKVEAALNEQLAKEFQSAYAYLGMSAYCESRSLSGFAQWLRIQFQEELDHGMRFYNFIIDRGGQVRLSSIEEPSVDFSSVTQVFDTALRQEQSVTQSIHDLYELVDNERDYASQAWLDWFATEQVEEEKNVGQIIDSLKMTGESGEALFMLDKELAQRQPEE